MYDFTFDCCQGSFVVVINLILYFTYFSGADTYGNDFPAQNCFLTSRHKANCGRMTNFPQTLLPHCYRIGCPGSLQFYIGVPLTTVHRIYFPLPFVLLLAIGFDLVIRMLDSVMKINILDVLG